MSTPGHNSSHPNKGTPPMQMSNHKRSLSFNHHLSYNQVHNNQVPQNKQNLLMNQVGNQPGLGRKNHHNSTKGIIEKTLYIFYWKLFYWKFKNLTANWNITNLRPAPPLRPSLANTSGSSGGTGTTTTAITTPALSSFSKKAQPTYEEDALVLRVIEAYCAAYQNTSRNTMHSGELFFFLI